MSELVITNVSVLTGKSMQPGLDVVIRDGMFASIGATDHRQMANATAINGSGKFLIAGLWESHTHLRPVLSADPTEAQAALDTAMSDYAARGITTVIDLGGPIDPFLAYRERQNGSHAAGARVLFAGPSFTGTGGWPLPLHHNPAMVNQIEHASQAAQTAASQIERNIDVVKLIYDGEPGSPEKLPEESLSTITAEAHGRGRCVLVHVHSAQDCVEALDAGVDGIEHSFLPTPGHEAAEAERVTELLLRKGAYLTPTLAIWEQLGRAGEATYLDELEAEGFMSAEEREGFQARNPSWGQDEFPHHPKADCMRRLEAAFEMLPTMHRAGVKFATGSDIATVLSRPGAALRELALLAKAGIPAPDVLLAATQHPANKLGLADSLGSVEPGKAADAVLLQANPLERLEVLWRHEHIAAVLQAGRAIYPAAKPAQG